MIQTAKVELNEREWLFVSSEALVADFLAEIGFCAFDEMMAKIQHETASFAQFDHTCIGIKVRD